uniref:F-box domain-containing protein n=1 Tax=Oryza brachyantha TaxID=4533 RepID=J3MWP0_ORYBR
MAPKEKDRSNKSTKAVARTTKRSPASPTTLGDLPDRILELILLSLPRSPVWLVRAAATCRRLRRVVTSDRFLSWINRPPLPPPVAGHYHYRRRASSSRRPAGRSLTFVPSASAPTSLGVDGRHFSLDFLPGGGSLWEPVDSGGSILLLAKKSTGATRRRRRFFRDLVVCEPVTRRYQRIPPVVENDDDADAAARYDHQHCLGVFLFLHDGDTCSIDMWGRARSSMARYRLICVVYRGYSGMAAGDEAGTIGAYSFDPNQGKRRNHRVRRPRWHDLIEVQPSWAMPKCWSVHIRGTDSIRFVGRAGGSLFWAMRDHNELLVLNEWPSGFGLLGLPADIPVSELQVVVDHGNGNNSEGPPPLVVDRGNLRVVCLDREHVLRVFATRRQRYGGDGEWVLERSLRLAAATTIVGGLAAGPREELGHFRGAAVKVVKASVGSVVLVMPVEETELVFSVDLETMEVARCKDGGVTYPCELPWLPTIRACVTPCARRGEGRCSHICICDDV